MYRTQLLKLPLRDCSRHLRFRLDPVIFPPANILLPGEWCVWRLCKWSCTCTNPGTSVGTHGPPVLELHRNKYGDGRCWHCHRICSAHQKKQTRVCAALHREPWDPPHINGSWGRKGDRIEGQEFKYGTLKSRSSTFRHISKVRGSPRGWVTARSKLWELSRMWPSLRTPSCRWDSGEALAWTSKSTRSSPYWGAQNTNVGA